jgi:hypothetical protein
MQRLNKPRTPSARQYGHGSLATLSFPALCLTSIVQLQISACPGEGDPVRQGEPLFAEKDMRQQENLRRFPIILDHPVIQYYREAL